MTTMPFKSQGVLTRAVTLHAAAVAAAVALGAGTVLASHRNSWETTVAAIGAGLAVLLAMSIVSLRRQLKPTAIVEKLLARLGEGTVDPFELPDLGVASPAAEGWSRLKRLAKRWTTLHELEQRVAEGLSHANSTAAGNVIDCLPDGVAVTDETGRIVQANAPFAAMCGKVDFAELDGSNCCETLQLPAECTARLGESAAGKRTSFEFAVAADGAARTLRVTRSPRHGAREEIAGHVWVVRDVTQQRLADGMRDNFLATATHELRTPLANIRAYAESLATVDDIDAESQKKFYNIIQSEAVRLSQLIDDLLDVSRMQAGALAIDRRETDLGRLVEEVSQKVEETMRSRQIDFRCELPPKYPKFVADKSKLAAAIVNLLGNAAKYTPEGGRVTFRVEVSERQLEFSVADTGIGIAADELDRVFERFFRSNDDRVRDITGSGLGLSLTQEVARLHGGDLTADSELNVGSTFRLTIPIESTEQ
ncbi:MAG: PAS domain-containing protein [Planctomycetales bacterium]|nr:PAS domain-containing protein [Planctomycetales bacterium]